MTKLTVISLNFNFFIHDFLIKGIVYFSYLLFIMLCLKRTRYKSNLDFHYTLLVNITNKVVQNYTIAVDVFDEVGTNGTETEITCNLLESEILECASKRIDDLKNEIDQGAHKRTVKIIYTSPSKVLFNNLISNHTYYLYCYSNQNTIYPKRICDTKEEIITCILYFYLIYNRFV